MLVKAIMIPFNQLQCIPINNTLKEALHIIESNRLLSLPVIDGKKFAGILSKQFVFETYFNEYEGSKDDFLAKKVNEMIKTSIMSIDKNLPIQDAAALFITSKIRFIPITDKDQNLLGIITQQAIFKEYQKIFGEGFHALTIYTYDFKGTLAKIAEIITKAGGNIKNIVQRDTDVMGLQEVNMRIDSENFEKVYKSLKKNGYDARSKEFPKV